MERLKYGRVAPEGLAAMQAVEHVLNSSSPLPQALLELVRLRSSVLNGCAFCEQTHRHELQRHHEPETRIAAVADWQDSDAFTPRERAALQWADVVTGVAAGGIPDEDYAAVSAFFEGKELVDLTMAISMMNAWNRLGVAFRPNWNPAKAPR